METLTAGVDGGGAGSGLSRAGRRPEPGLGGRSEEGYAAGRANAEARPIRRSWSRVRAAQASARKAIQASNTEPYYADVLKGWQDKGAKPASAAIDIPGASPASVSSSADIRAGGYEGRNNVLIWNGSANGFVEYQVNVPADGLYEMQVSYRPVTGKGLRRPIIWNVLLDGKLPFREASSITLYRQWKDARPIKKDEEGDDIRPKSEEISGWKVQPLFDSGGAYADPLQWYLTKGTHTPRLEGYEPVAIESIRLAPPQKLKPYAEAAGAYPASKPVQADVLTLQAEEPEVKSDSAIQMVSDTDQRTVPLAKGKITFNSIGGKKWWNQNQELTWSFDVPESGKYKIGAHAAKFYLAKSVLPDDPHRRQGAVPGISDLPVPV
ncbi:hypothetical protein LJK88_05200 [Paenibacillus sp. P26]|nr:hypothetical protein LJK88_05200 [Paenibacillus sp. P26]